MSYRSKETIGQLWARHQETKTFSVRPKKFKPFLKLVHNLINIHIYREYILGFNILFLALDSVSQQLVVQKNHLGSFLNAGNSG